MPARKISEQRKFVYYLGMGISAIGLIAFFSVFALIGLSALGLFNGGFDSNSVGRLFRSGFIGIPTLGFGGFFLIVVGQFLMRLGRAGLAGVGLVLDPQRTRKDLEPWNRMKGGMVKDALDEAGIDLGQSAAALGRAHGMGSATVSGRGIAGSPPVSPPLPFDEQLRRLHALYEDGIVTQAEYETKKREILEKS